MRTACQRIAVVTVAVGVLVAGASGCSNSTGPKRPSRTVSQQTTDRHDFAVDQALNAMHRAAVSGDRAAVARAQQQLERLARTNPTPAAKSGARDPFERMLADFAFKRAPLFVQQVSSTDGNHRIYVSVDRAAFCLLAPAARQAAVSTVYRSTDRRLRAEGVTDLQFVVVPLTETAATFDQALAVGRHRSARLTRAGRKC